jgi:hypothetical protein
MARGDRLPDAALGRDAALRAQFEFIGSSIPAAALTRSLDASDAEGALWLRADPAWLAADAVTLRLLAVGDLGLSSDESTELVRALKPLFGDAGFPLEAATTSRWYLRCPAGAQLPAFSPPQAALGDDAARHLPEGGEGKRWRHLLNEAQVMLHHHPVNQERARRNLPPVNSVWVWGAGKLPDWVRSARTAVISDDEIVQALAQRAGVDLIPVMAGIPETIDESASLVIDQASVRDVTSLEARWLEPAQQALACREIEHVDLHFVSGERFRYRRVHRWRFWRRVKSSASA